MSGCFQCAVLFHMDWATFKDINCMSLDVTDCWKVIVMCAWRLIHSQSPSFSLCCPFSRPLWFTVAALAGVFLKKRKPQCSCPEKSFICDSPHHPHLSVLGGVPACFYPSHFLEVLRPSRSSEKWRGCRWASSGDGRSLRWGTKLDLNEATVFIKSNQINRKIHSREAAQAARWWMSSSALWHAPELRNSLKVRVKLSGGSHPQIWLACLSRKQSTELMRGQNPTVDAAPDGVGY